MGINPERANFVANILLANGANQYGGMTARELLDAIPDIPERTMYSILKQTGFKQCERAVWPKQFWYDVSEKQKIKKVPVPVGNGENRVELSPYDGKEFITNLKYNGEALITAHKMILNYNHEDKAKFHNMMNQLEEFALKLQERVQQTKAHSFYDTPEWWRIYNDEVL